MLMQTLKVKQFDDTNLMILILTDNLKFAHHMTQCSMIRTGYSPLKSGELGCENVLKFLGLLYASKNKIQ